MRLAVTSVRKANAEAVLVAVPTGHRESLQKAAAQVEAIYCANVRGGSLFAVADAYQCWDDINESRARHLLKSFEQGRKDRCRGGALGSQQGGSRLL